MATISIDDFISWCTIYEPTAFASITETTDYITEQYNNSVDYMQSIRCYFEDSDYRLLVYRYALHLIIVFSDSQTDGLETLYEKYDIVHSGEGILSSASAESSSSSYMSINKISEGDAETVFLWMTKYGKMVEAVFSQLSGIPIVITK